MHTQACLVHTPYSIQSITVLAHFEQTVRMEFQNDGVVSDPQLINRKKNPILWDYRIAVALCLGLCHSVFIRLVTIVALVYGFSV